MLWLPTTKACADLVEILFQIFRSLRSQNVEIVIFYIFAYKAPTAVSFSLKRNRSIPFLRDKKLMRIKILTYTCKLHNFA